MSREVTALQMPTFDFIFANSLNGIATGPSLARMRQIIGYQVDRSAVEESFTVAAKGWRYKC